MLEWWNTVSLFVIDGLLGWLLLLPRDVVIIAVAIISAVVLTLIRRWTTNQELLARIAYDKKRLRDLARTAPDRAAKTRFISTRSSVMLKALRAEGRPLLISLLPIGLLATWCIYRLEYQPPTGNEMLTVTVETPISRVGLPIHLVPQDGLTTDGWVREVVEVKQEGQVFGQATWQLQAKPSAQTYPLLFRLDRRHYQHNLVVGQSHYAPPLDIHSDEVVTRVDLKQVRLFGVVPGIDLLAFPPWLVAYLLLTIPCALAVKRLTGTW